MEIVCKKCGRKLKNKLSIKKQIGPTCESRMLAEFYKTQQITIDEILTINKRKEA